MIRINLLPQAKRQIASAGPGGAQTWYLIYAGASAAFCLLLGVIYFVFSSELEEKVAVNSRLRSEIQTIQQRSARIEEVRAELERSRSLEAVVAEIQVEKTGPIRLLMEISKILSTDGGPTIAPEELERLRRDNPLAGYNPAWDPSRLSLRTFGEADDDPALITLEGQGRTNEDVAEFLRRLELSELFSEVRLVQTMISGGAGAGSGAAQTGPRQIDFELTCKVTY